MDDTRISDVQRIAKWVTRDVLAYTQNNAELAHQVTEVLASLDWQQMILDQRQKEINERMQEMERFLLWRENGGDFCDECQPVYFAGQCRYSEMHGKVYAWPYAVYPYPYVEDDAEISGRHYCWKCFYKRQIALETKAIRRYRDSPPTLSKAVFLQWTKGIITCHRCKRLFPSQSGHCLTGHIYCFHCVEYVVEQQFINCQVCSKKTASSINNFCYDCYPLPNAWETNVSSHRSRARSSKTPATLTADQWRKTVVYFNQKCAYCQSRPFQALEHFIPLNKGGGTTVDNCVPACQHCNSHKGTVHPDQLSSFPRHVIERIRNYLQSDHQKIESSGMLRRDLVVVKA